MVLNEFHHCDVKHINVLENNSSKQTFCHHATCRTEVSKYQLHVVSADYKLEK